MVIFWRGYLWGFNELLSKILKPKDQWASFTSSKIFGQGLSSSSPGSSSSKSCLFNAAPFLISDFWLDWSDLHRPALHQQVRQPARSRRHPVRLLSRGRREHLPAGRHIQEPQRRLRPGSLLQRPRQFWRPGWPEVEPQRCSSAGPEQGPEEQGEVREPLAIYYWW